MPVVLFLPTKQKDTRAIQNIITTDWAGSKQAAPCPRDAAEHELEKWVNPLLPEKAPKARAVTAQTTTTMMGTTIYVSKECSGC